MAQITIEETELDVLLKGIAKQRFAIVPLGSRFSVIEITGADPRGRLKSRVIKNLDTLSDCQARLTDEITEWVAGHIEDLKGE